MEIKSVVPCNIHARPDICTVTIRFTRQEIVDQLPAKMSTSGIEICGKHYAVEEVSFCLDADETGQSAFFFVKM